MVSVLTSGKCTDYSQCYRPFDKYESFVNKTNMVFGITDNAGFNFLKLNSLILKNNWNFIVALINNDKKIARGLANLMETYGIKQSSDVA